MPQQPIELILSRQFADSLNMAAFLVDPVGNLLFYNVAAEGILGLRFSETGSMAVEEWSTAFKPTDENGDPLPPEVLPLVKTLSDKRPAHGSIYINSKAGGRHMITITSFPIEGRSGKNLGAMALFWRS